MTGRRQAAAGAAFAVAWLLAVVLVDALTSARIVFAVLFAVAPLFVSAVLGPVWTSGFAVAATGLAAASGLWNHAIDGGQQVIRVVDVAAISAAAVVISAVRVRRERRMSQIVAIADAAQRAILPTLPERLRHLRVATRYLSAAEEALVGGDLYDVIETESGVRALVGDVRGKGLDGVQHAARVIRAFRQSAAAVPDLPAVAKHMNDYLRPFLDDEDFVTAVLVEFLPQGGLTLVGCGHQPPLLLSSGAVREIEVDGLPFGLASSFEAVTVPWRPGDRLLLYTDGLVEARDARGRFLPPQAITDCLQLADPDEALDGLLAALTAHVAKGRLADDLALVLIDGLP